MILVLIPNALSPFALIMHQPPEICNPEATEFLFSNFPTVEKKPNQLPKDNEVKLSPMPSIRDTARAL